MTSLVLESALRATLVIASVAVVLKALRVESPAIRHALWTGVLILMLLLPALVAWGPNAPLPVLPTEAVGRATSVFSAGTTNQIVAAAPLALWAWQTIVPAAYLVGLITLLFRLALSMSEVRSLRREARPIGGRLTHERCASPIVVGYVRPMVILPRGWSAWTEEQLDAVLLHEGEHIRRRDPLIQWVALLNRAVFWFHPLAWWLERHLSALAEDACDDAVLARGHDAQEYCQHLIALARAASQAGARIQATAVAMAGARLPRRIHRILQGINAPQISRLRLACAAAAFVAIGVVCGSGTLTHAEGLNPLGTLVALPNQSDGRRSALIADGAVSQASVAGQDKGLTLPRPIREVKPEYTALAKEMRIQGTVWMKVVVLVSGDVGDVEVTRSLDTQYGLDDQAIEAVRQWKFEPGRRDGKVVPVQVTIEMSFTLR
jgi:TonB family protein